MKGVIRLNDPLIGGGKVIKATGADFMGKPVALSGDLVQCPKGHSLSMNVIQPGPCTARGLWWMVVTRPVAAKSKAPCLLRGLRDERVVVIQATARCRK